MDLTRLFVGVERCVRKVVFGVFVSPAPGRFGAAIIA